MVDPARLRRLPGRGEEGVQGRHSPGRAFRLEDWITRDRAEIARLSAEITKAEAEIDSIVYGLFDLTPDEIALLESVV